MPEPNLPPLRLSLIDGDDSNAVNVPLLQKQLPELPASLRQNLVKKYGLSMLNVLRLLVSIYETENYSANYLKFILFFSSLQNEPVLLNHFLHITQDYPKIDIMKIWNFLMMEVLHALNSNKLPAEEW